MFAIKDRSGQYWNFMNVEWEEELNSYCLCDSEGLARACIEMEVEGEVVEILAVEKSTWRNYDYMRAHTLAAELLEQPNYPVTIGKNGSSEEWNFFATIDVRDARQEFESKFTVHIQMD